MLPCRHTQCKHSLTHKFIRYTLIVLHWTLFFPLRTSLILHGADSTTCWKPCSEMLVHVNMTVSFSCYIYISSTISQRCSVGLRSRDGVFFSRCHWHSHQKMSTLGQKGMTTVGNNAQVGCGIYCGVLLQKLTSDVFRDSLLYTLFVTVLYLSYCCPLIS